MRTLYFCPVVSSSFFLSFFYLFSSPNLSRRRLELDVYHTSAHGVALERIYDAGLKRAAGGSLKIQDAKNRQKFAIWAPPHKFVGLYLRWDRFVSLGHPSNFQRVSRLGSVLDGNWVMGVSQTLRRWAKNATYIRQGGHHVGHWPTF